MPLKNEEKALKTLEPIIVSTVESATDIAQVYALLAIAEAIYESNDPDKIAKAIDNVSDSIAEYTRL